MKQLLAITLFICCAYTGVGQAYTIKGSAADTLNYTPLPMASVVLLRAADSAITAFTRTDSNGNFSLTTAKPGKYIVRITFPNFGDYIDAMNISKAVTDIGKVPMFSKEHLLKEFVLTKQISAIKIKGDTTEYVADSFKVKENANVQDLLKRLPGISVDKDGKVTAQGETVQKILVDGEEFFSDDPKVVTQGLQANAVDKVQVYDKKSDQAEFTGIDDGQKTKTINLQLKEDRKKGFFGKLDAGAGTDGYFQDQGMLNAFKGKRQFSAFGIMSNTDKVGLGWQDNGKFGSGNESISDGDGGMYTISSNSDDNFSGWDGRYTGEGLPKIWTGGVHFADKWDEDKDHVTANYRYGRQQVEMNGDATTQYGLAGDTSNISTTRSNQFSKAERHGLDAMYELKIDSNNTIKLSASAGYKTSDVLSVYNTMSALHTTEVDAPLYTNNRSISSNTNANFLNAELLYKKKFKKKGRTLSVDVKENYKLSTSDGHLLSSLVPDSVNAVTTNIDQDKKNNSNTLAFTAKATYTEPITKVMNMEVNYGAGLNNTTAENRSYNNTGGSYTQLDSTYSSYYKYNILSNTGGINFRWVYKKTNFFIGSDISDASYLQTDLYRDTSHRYNYVNLFPKAGFKYKVNNQSSLNFNYYGSTQQPTITQIQPLKQNTDPTNITVGNPALKESFTNAVSLWYNDYKVLTHRWLYANLNASYINNAISTSQTYNDGINTTQFVNVNGNYTMQGWVGAGFKLNKPDLNIGAHFAPALNHTNNFINGQKNTNNDNSFDVGPEFSMYKEDKFEFSFNRSITYYDNKATISTYSTNYWLSNNELSVSFQLPKKFEIGSNANFMFREQTAIFTSNNNVVKWNAYFSKKFLKKSDLELRVSVFDILNQNIGYARTAQGNIITQNNYNTIRRYGMINLVWNFTYRPGNAAETEESK